MEAQCLPGAISDLIIGNAPGARPPEEPDTTWQEVCAVSTKSQAKKDGQVSPLKVPCCRKSPIVDKEKLKQMQSKDESLRKYWDGRDVLVKGQAEISFEEKYGILYRIYKHPFVNGGKPVKQVMVPVQLIPRIMAVAHGSLMGGHLGIKKTTDKIQSAFYWPGIQGDVTRCCKCLSENCKQRMGSEGATTEDAFD